MDGNFLSTLLQAIGQPQASPGLGSFQPTIPRGDLTDSQVPPWPTPWLDTGQGPPVSGGTSPLESARSILGLPQQPPVNVMQAAAPVDASDVPSIPEPEGKTASPPQKSRHSLLETVGRVADAFARFGGAEPGYQNTLDAQDARKRATVTQGQHDTLADQQINQGADEAVTRHNTLVGTAVRALQAIRRQNPQADINTVWPLLARQAGIPDDQAARLSQIFATHPEAVDGIAAITAGHQEYNGQVIYARDPQGHLAAFQPSNNNNSEARNILPTGYTPIDPLTFINTGNAQVGVHSRSGEVSPTILPIAEAPGHAADRGERAREANQSSATTITVAGMPARAAAAANAHATGDPTNGLTLLNNIENAFGTLHRLNALPGDDGGTVGNIVGAIGRTHLGQAIGEQAGSPAAQTRLEIGKNVSALQQEMLRSLPASATRTRFEQEMLARGLPDPARMSYSTARTVIAQLRESYTRALAASRRQAGSGGGTPATRTAPPAGGIPTLTPAQARNLPSGARFRTTDGRVLVRP